MVMAGDTVPLPLSLREMGHRRCQHFRRFGLVLLRCLLQVNPIAITITITIAIANICAGYEDGFITVHDLLSGDCISSVQVLPSGFIAQRFIHFRAATHDPFIYILCLPSPSQSPSPSSTPSSKILVVRVGLGEGYRGSVSLIASLDHQPSPSPPSSLSPPISPSSSHSSSPSPSPSPHVMVAYLLHEDENIILVSLTSDCVLHLWDFVSGWTHKSVFHLQMTKSFQSVYCHQ